MMFRVDYPVTDATLRWLEVIFAERFGQVWSLLRSKEGLRLQLVGSEGAIIFDKLEEGFSHAHSDQPCTWWDASGEGWLSVLGGSLPAPGVAELPMPLIETRADEHIIHYDIPGLTYWMLARVEEIGRTDLDEHGRFPATASHAYKHSYLERPIVDEWLYILGQVIKCTWPGVELINHQFSTRVSHDVDSPSRYAFRTTGGMLRAMGGDVLKFGNLKSALLAPWVRMKSKTALNPSDRDNTFDWIMDTSERNGLTSTFFFICGRTQPSKDADYEPDHPAIRELMRRIHSRGHEIGLHPSYGSYKSPLIIKQEADRLRRIAVEEGIEQSEWTARMHYLRWEHPTTLRALDDAGIVCDGTLGYADRMGFRCGSCFEYPAFDPIVGEEISIRVRPLIAMEVTAISMRYMGLGIGIAAQAKLLQLKHACRAVRGCFTLLWHNSELVDSASRQLYSSLLKNDEN